MPYIAYIRFAIGLLSKPVIDFLNVVRFISAGLMNFLMINKKWGNLRWRPESKNRGGPGRVLRWIRL